MRQNDANFGQLRRAGKSAGTVCFGPAPATSSIFRLLPRLLTLTNARLHWDDRRTVG